MVNTGGMVTLDRSYDPYGVVRSNAQLANGTPYGFTSEFTESTGMVYLRARHYDPAIGNFISRDTWMGNVYNPLSLNRWAYVFGNPVNMTDPTGHAPDETSPPPPKQPLCILCPLFPWYFDVTDAGSKRWYSQRQSLAQRLGLDQNADNFPDLLLLSLLQYDYAELTGEALEKIKQDPEMRRYEADIIEAAKGRKGYGSLQTDEYLHEPQESIPFGGSDQGGILVKLKAGTNELTWMLRHVVVWPTVVTKAGTINIFYRINDQFDLSPDKKRDFWYNLCSMTTGLPYHAGLGGNIHMRIYAHWQTTIKPSRQL